MLHGPIIIKFNPYESFTVALQPHEQWLKKFVSSCNEATSQNNNNNNNIKYRLERGFLINGIKKKKKEER